MQRMSAEEKILDKLLPDFQQLLNLQELIPYIKRAHLLTDREFEELNADLEGQEFEAVRRLVSIVKGKGASCATKLVNVLQQYVTEVGGEYRLVQLIGRLERELGAVEGLWKSNEGCCSTNGVPEGTHVPDSNGRSMFFPAALPDSLQDSTHQQFVVSPSSNLGDSPKHLVQSPHAHDKHGLLEHTPVCSSNEPVQLMKYEYLISPHQSYRDLSDIACTLVRESKMVRNNFADFVLRVCDMLEKSQVPVEKVRLSLQYLGCYEHQPSAQCQIFDGTSAISKANSINNLLSALHECSSWFNYSLVAYIAKHFGGDEGEQLVEAYESQLKSYFKRLIFQCPPFSSDESRIPGGFEALEVIVDRDFRTCSLQDVAIFKFTLSTLLGLRPSVFILRAIDEIQLDGARTRMSWSIPACTIPYTIGQATSKTDEFTREGACSMRVGMKILDFSPKKLEHSPRSTYLAYARPTKLYEVASSSCPPPPSLYKNAFSSVQSQKTPPSVSTTSHQAFGIPAVYAPQKEKKPDPEPSRSRNHGDKYSGSLQVLELAQSPVHKKGAYFQFYYNDRRERASCASGEKRKKKRFLPAQLHKISNQLSHDNKSSQEIVAVRPSAKTQRKSIASTDNQGPSSSSHQHLQTISIRKFKSSNQEIGSAQSADIVSIVSVPLTHEESHRSVQQATSDDTQTVDVMLIAASEARQRRGRRRNLNNTCGPMVMDELREEDNSKLDHADTSTPQELVSVTAVGSEPARPLELPTSQLSQPEVSASWLAETLASTSKHESFDFSNTSMHVTKQSYNATSLLESEKYLDRSSMSSVLSPPFTAICPPPTKSRKSVAFLWRVLGRARPNMPANIHVAAIQTVHAVRKDELQVYSGQQLKALYRIARRVFVETQEERKGFVPYSCIRISRKYYGSNSNIVQLSYSQLYVQSPDGIEDYAISSLESKPSYTEIEMVTIQDHMAVSRENLSVKCGDRVRVLYCDDSWVYGVSEDHRAGCLPRNSCRLTRRSQAIFKAWNTGKLPFQADFVIKFNESPPVVLRQQPVSLADVPTHISKVGKVMTVTRSYIPNACNSNNITIRKGLRVQILQADGELLKVTTKSGASFWIPSKYLRPAHKTSDAKTFSKEAASASALMSEPVESNSPKRAPKEASQCVYESIPSISSANVSALLTNITSGSNESSLASLKSAPSIPSLSYRSMDSTGDLMSLQSLELSLPVETSNTQ